MINTSNITAIDLSIDIAIGIHSVERGESLKYELWHFVGGAILAQNLRFSNHCHFAQRSALIIHKVFALLSFSRGVSLASVLGGSKRKCLDFLDVERMKRKHFTIEFVIEKMEAV